MNEGDEEILANMFVLTLAGSVVRMVVTGANGFIGSHAVQHFMRLGEEVHGLDVADPSPPQASPDRWHRLSLADKHFTSIIEEVQPYALIHAAGPALVGRSIEHPFEDLTGSVSVWASVLESVRMSNVPCRCVYLSSAAVYGMSCTLPMHEDSTMRPVSPYGYHKRMCEELSEYYARLFDLQVCTLRLFSAYGKGLRKQILWDTCQKALKGRSVRLMGTGEETRDFVEVTDICRAIETVLARGEFEAGVYNVAGGTGTSIREVAEGLVRGLGTDNTIEFSGEQRAGDPVHYLADISRMREVGWEPSVSIGEGLAAYAEWFLMDRSAGA
jgi:UDP-glucose 4-epimerase